MSVDAEQKEKEIVWCVASHTLSNAHTSNDYGCDCDHDSNSPTEHIQFDSISTGVKFEHQNFWLTRSICSACVNALHI